MNSAVVLFLDRVEKVNWVIETGITINSLFVLVLPLTQQATKITLSNVPPFITEFLSRELSRHGKRVSPIKKILDLTRLLDPGLRAIVPDGLSIHRQDRTIQYSQGRAREEAIISMDCSEDLEHLMIRCQPYYLPWEFTSVVMTAVYVPPHADTNKAMDELYGVIDRTETITAAEAAFIVARGL
ncbi:hypothetical protein L3Q82_025373 [Scortum barcoo]|uniref:Uncharacterized protein n=1 Tax=Scortum barcoo TaxID=214431 RepID=A0ACB8WL67_9TELE|nr:hypothetical protein L3Q82_025373 [Scortum barcoo]